MARKHELVFKICDDDGESFTTVLSNSILKRWKKAAHQIEEKDDGECSVFRQECLKLAADILKTLGD